MFDDPVDMRRTKEFLHDPRHHLAVAVDDGMVVGFVSAVHYIHPDKPAPELWINEVGVAESYRQRGVGKALLDLILAEGRKAGCWEAWVLTDESNTPAMRFYAASGGIASPDIVMFSFPLQPDAPEAGR